MAGFSHCVQCGRRLRNAFFCSECGQALCGRRCLDQHLATHVTALQAPPQPEREETRRTADREFQDDARPEGAPKHLSLFLPCFSWVQLF